MDVTPIRSQTYQKMFSDEFMMQTFGTLTPSLQQRTSYFMGLWMEWRNVRVLLRSDNDRSRMRSQNRSRELIRSLGYQEFHDFQIRNGEIRFANPEILAMCMMGGLKEHVERGPDV